MLDELWGNKTFKFETSGVVQVMGMADAVSLNEVCEKDIMHRAESMLISGLANEIVQDLKPKFIKKHKKAITDAVMTKMEENKDSIISDIARNAVNIALEEDDDYDD